MNRLGWCPVLSYQVALYKFAVFDYNRKIKKLKQRCHEKCELWKKKGNDENLREKSEKGMRKRVREPSQSKTDKKVK